jgi:hypothetical protein
MLDIAQSLHLVLNLLVAVLLDMDDLKMSFVRAQCKGTVIGCERCKGLYNDRGGFCRFCGRSLDKVVGHSCGVAFAYVERGYVWRGKVRIKCRFCKHVNVI